MEISRTIVAREGDLELRIDDQGNAMLTCGTVEDVEMPVGDPRAFARFVNAFVAALPRPGRGKDRAPRRRRRQNGAEPCPTPLQD